MPEKLINFNGDSDQYHELQLLAKRENTTVKKLFNDFMEDYNKKHKEGNPQHLITSSIENEDFIGFPSIAIDYDKKKSYILKNCVEPLDKDRLNPFGVELWNNVTQWYHLLETY